MEWRTVTIILALESKVVICNKITVFIRLQAERFLHKSSLNLGKFEAVEGVSAYSQVFFIKKNFSAN